MILPRILPLAAISLVSILAIALGQTAPTTPAQDAPAATTSTEPASSGAEKKSEKGRAKSARGNGNAKQTQSTPPKPGPHAEMDFPSPATDTRPQDVAPPINGERIVFLGNGLAERDVYYSRLETELHLRYPESHLFVRNMARSGDTPAFRPHAARVSQWAFPGAEKFRPEFAMHNGKGFFPMPDQWLTFLKADTIVAFFGYNESFDGPDRVGNFEAELDAFLAGGHVARLGVLDENGWPYVVSTWYQWADGGFYIIPRARSKWAQFMANDGRVSISLDSNDPPYIKVQTQGVAELLEEPNTAYALHEARRWLAAEPSIAADSGPKLQ